MMTEDSFRSSGLRAGRLFGIDIWLHWVLLAIIALKLIDILLEPGGHYGAPMVAFASFALALLVTILLHEFGHAYAAYRQGGDTEKIILWPLGGLAVCNAPQHPGSQFWVAAGGPLVNLGLGLLAMGACLARGWNFLPFSSELVFWQRLVQNLFLWNFVLLIVNLLPCYPLDGGRILHSLLWNRMGTHHGALELTLRISKFTAILALVFGGATIVLGFSDKNWRFENPFIDELGFVPLSKTGAELLFELISQRYERGSTLITSNLPFDEWTEVFGSERLTGALLDRLTHHVHILEMNGDSYRLNQSKKRRKSPL